MPVTGRRRRPAAEFNAGGFHHLGRAAVGELHRNLFRMTQTVAPRVDARHHDRLPLLGRGGIVIPAHTPPQDKGGDKAKSGKQASGHTLSNPH
jgi:hypothetical protein